MFEQGCYGRADGGEECGGQRDIAVIVYGYLAGTDVKAQEACFEAPRSYPLAPSTLIARFHNPPVEEGSVDHRSP